MERSIGLDPEKGIRKQTRNWMLFDFANSLLYTNVILYFPQWLTIEMGISDLNYNILLTITTILLLITSPLLGIWADKKGKRVWFLKVTSIIMIFGTLLIPIVALLGSSKMMIIGMSILGFCLLNYSYQLSLLFYDAMLGDLVHPEKYLRISGLGLASGWLGAIIGILAVYPIAQGSIAGISGRILALLGASILFILIGAYPLFKMKEITSYKIHNYSTNTNIFKHLWNDLRSLRQHPTILLFLTSYWLYIDAILTFENNLTIYLERVYATPDTMKALVAILIIVGGIIGATLTAFFIKHEKSHKTLLITLILSSFGFIALSLAPTFSIFLVILFGMALLFGSILAVSRGIYTTFVPEGQRNEYFGFFSIAERSASIIGPLVWGGVIAIFVSLNVFRYNLALMAMGIIMALSIIPLMKMRNHVD